MLWKMNIKCIFTFHCILTNDTRDTSLFNVNDTLVRQFSNPWLLFLSLTHNHEVGAEMFYLWYFYLYDITSGTLHTLRKAR
jgi:hypothetical protein